ncbi:hypothetical protein ACWOA0_05720 [Ignavigranum ruoffiae]|uniref:Uncharacterized protein n=1 Tax=Ignavigranum ruoffiae TaxID=89093 RepID=A0A1H9BVV3_9LACT|nr:hypothetical protein [Ignavigranum ruoffiae]SEP93106.1 hypothetical protein SAMN04488558_103122 [Ignavigranum ruoffiae]
MSTNNLKEIVKRNHDKLLKDIFSNKKILERNAIYLKNGKIAKDKMSIVALLEAELFASNLLVNVLDDLQKEGYLNEPNHR